MKPFDVPMAERGFIGALLIRPALIGDVVALVEPDDLLSPSARSVYSAMVTLWRRGIEPTTHTILDELTANAPSIPDGWATELHGLMSAASSTYPAKFVPSIQEHSLRRRVITRCKQAQEIAADPNVPASDALDQARELFANVDVPGQATNELVDSVEFVAGDDSYDWLVPWLIERGERMLVVAGESGGKSMLLRMLAVCCAWGIHPWNNQSVTQRRVVLVDLENPVNLIRRKMRPMVAQARAQRPLADPSMLSLLCRPGGINVAKPSDARWLAGQLSLAQPDLVVCGPLYKMFDADDKWESGARAVTTVLDDLRTRMGFSLILETHAPQEYGGKRNLRPIGSSIWLRWPEFVMSFAPLDAHPNVVRITTLKGRDERHWPTFMERGGLWPWTPCRDPEGPKGQPDPPPVPRENTGPNFSQSEAF